MSQLVRVSPSQIATWIDCPRKWAYDRWRPRKPNKYALFGTNTHDVLAKWLAFGVPPKLDMPEGACALAGLHLLPMPPQQWVEVPFEFVYDGILYNGIRDLVSGYTFGAFALVTDHKTTGDLDWAKTEEELLWDPQWLIYGVATAIDLTVSYIGGQWVYYQRKPPRAVDRLVYEHVNTLWPKFLWQHERYVLPLANSRRIMPDAAWSELWIDAHPRCENAGSRDSACVKYGGCQHKAECLTDPVMRMMNRLIETPTTSKRRLNVLF